MQLKQIGHITILAPDFVCFIKLVDNHMKKYRFHASLSSPCFQNINVQNSKYILINVEVAVTVYLQIVIYHTELYYTELYYPL